MCVIPATFFSVSQPSSVSRTSQTTWTITATINALVFVPDSISITFGDSVNFSLASPHDAVEVSEATWQVNGNTSNGGFQVPFGGGLAAQLGVGVHYYVCTPHAASGMKGRIFVTAPTSVRDEPRSIPGVFQLFQNYPNPFNPSTVIEYLLLSPGNVTVAIYNSLGKRVRVLYSGDLPSGTHSHRWDSKDDQGSLMATGIYFYQVNVGGLVQTRKALLLK
ncbi:MAG: T9SS type A sorting domain-containing protein [Ignavibacteriales bacterium]|nr:T9SS type A sorting domain-containing protein [Ignavibacteriales bacterium]